jgi:hypothetical protein
MTALAVALAIVPAGWSPFSLLCELDEPAVNESSGLAASLRGPGVFYTHNDSGDTPRVFRFDKTGHVSAVFSLPGTAVDWEDMDAAVVGGVPYLYLADVGDNGSVRAFVTVHRVPEPALNQGSGALAAESFRFRYPDGAHDCEAVFVGPDGAVWFVTKERTRPAALVFRGVPVAGQTVTLEAKGSLSIDTGGLGGKLVTGASLAHRSPSVVVRTYTGVQTYRAATLDGWWAAAPQSVGQPVEAQGEAVCFGLDDRSILTSSEGTPCPVSISTWKLPRVSSL